MPVQRRRSIIFVFCHGERRCSPRLTDTHFMYTRNETHPSHTASTILRTPVLWDGVGDGVGLTASEEWEDIIQHLGCPISSLAPPFACNHFEHTTVVYGRASPGPLRRVSAPWLDSGTRSRPLAVLNWRRTGHCRGLLGPSCRVSPSILASAWVNFHQFCGITIKAQSVCFGCSPFVDARCE